MHHDKADIMMIKQMRGFLLTNLDMFYPHSVQLATLYRTVCGDPNYNKVLFTKDISYFEDKGYIDFVDNQFGGMDEFMKKVCILTATGKEVAEGTVTDNALEI